MSTIVAVVKNNKACIAADSLTTFGDVRQSAEYDRTSEKILKHEDNYVGIVGSAAHHLVMKHVFENEADLINLSSSYEIYQTFLNLHPILKQQYFLNAKDEDDDAYESSRIDALIINKQGLFGVYALREVFEYKKFWAIGAGAEIALGALYAMYDRSEDVEQIVTCAIEASAEFHTSSALPLSKYCIELSKNN